MLNIGMLVGQLSANPKYLTHPSADLEIYRPTQTGYWAVAVTMPHVVSF